jgi:hypothetical protein
MKQTVNKHDFHDAFRIMDRLENFTYEAREALFDYLEQYEEGLTEEIELDVIALCCDYQQDTWEDIAANYSIDLPETHYVIVSAFEEGYWNNKDGWGDAFTATVFTQEEKETCNLPVDYHGTVEWEALDNTEEKIEAVKEYLEDNTIVIDSFDDGTILYQVF